MTPRVALQLTGISRSSSRSATFFKTRLPFSGFRKGKSSHLFKMQLMLFPPFSKYLCWDISGEGTSAELMQCVRSRVTQSLTSPAALRAILRMCPLLLLQLQLQLQLLLGAATTPNTFHHHHALTQYHLLLNCVTHRSISQQYFFLTD